MTEILKRNHSSKSFDWLVGHDFLDVCCQLLQSQVAADNFTGTGSYDYGIQNKTHSYLEFNVFNITNLLCWPALADLLHLVASTYSDIDVCDRAKQYYAMLTCLSSTKVRNFSYFYTSEQEVQMILLIITGIPFQVSTLLAQDPVGGGKQSLVSIVKGETKSSILGTALYKLITNYPTVNKSTVICRKWISVWIRLHHSCRRACVHVYLHPLTQIQSCWLWLFWKNWQRNVIANLVNEVLQWCISFWWSLYRTTLYGWHRTCEYQKYATMNSGDECGIHMLCCTFMLLTSFCVCRMIMLKHML